MAIFNFAWVSADEPFGATHLREDEKIVSFDLGHREGDIPTLEITVRNPHIGLLAPGRLQWCWFSMDGIPLFHGRVMALPTDLLAEAVTLHFVARPRDFLAQKLAVATVLKVRPYYDEIWIDPGQRTVTDTTSPFFGTFDPDLILETYSHAWHIDRVSNVVTTSDITFGDSDEVFEPHEVPYDSVSIEFSQNPVMAVFFTGTVEWTQQNSGIVTAVKPRTVPSTHDFSNDFPKTGADLGGGWRVNKGHAFDATPQSNTQSGSFSYSNTEQTHICGDTMSASSNWSYTPVTTPSVVSGSKFEFSRTFGDCDTGVAWALSANSSIESASGFNIAAGLDLEWDMENGRKETVQFLLTSDMQPIITYPDDEPPVPEQLQLHGSDVGVALTDGEVPIGDLHHGAFFPSDRGLSAIQYPLLMARAKLIQSMRAVKITFEIPVERAVALSCRKNAFLYDPRLPGGQALGKITEYHIKGDGDSGAIIASVQIECTIGNAGAITATVGTPEYVEETYVAHGYQFYDGESLILPSGDIGFEVLRDPLVGSVGVGQDAIIRSEFNEPDLVSWQAAFDAAMPSSAGEAGKAAINLSGPPNFGSQPQQFYDFIQRTEPVQPVFQLELAPVAGYDFETTYNLVTTPVIAPKMIDLAAGST